MNQKSQKKLTQNRWIWLTTAGWFIGILLIFVLGIFAEIILPAKEESGSQLGIGIAMGIGVGLMQWVVLRKYLESVQKWLWFSILGFTLSYVSFDIIASNVNSNLKPEVVLPFATTMGALISSWLQYKFILRNITPKAYNWIAYSTIAWLLAHLFTMGTWPFFSMPIPFKLPKIFYFIVMIIYPVVGGPLLGYITGRFIVPVINKQNPNEP